jgi:triosephosphate isomerase
MKPIIIINFKTYKTRKQDLILAKTLEKVSGDVVVAVQAANISEIARNTRLKVFAQHVDPVKPGRHTGFITPESVKAQGAIGTFLSHSEHKLDLKTLKQTLKHCKQVKLKTAVFAKDLAEAKKMEKLKPDFLIYEPPELVADKKVSVSTTENNRKDC